MVMNAGRQARAAAGFTLVEVIAVLVIIGILAAVAVSRLGDSQSQVVATADKLKVHLRHAQFRAMYSDKTWGLAAAGSSYWLFSAGDTGNRSMFLGEETDTVALPAGITVGNFVISFDSWGRPHDGADPATATPYTAPLALSVASSAHTVAITMYHHTGFIP